MQNFLKTLTSGSKNAELPEIIEFFGQLVGSWEIEYAEDIL